MTKTIWQCTIAALLTLSSIATVQAEIIDEIVATVDREVILKSDVMSEIAVLLPTLPANEVESAFRKALEQAVEQRILVREAQFLGVVVSDDEIEDRLTSIISQYPSYDEFLRALEDAGETMSDFRERLRKQIMAISLSLGKRRQFAKEAIIAESDMLQYYQDHEADFHKPERVLLRRIFLPAGEDQAERKKVKARLMALRDELDQGGSFSGLADLHSQGPEEEGGLMGWMQKGELVPELEDAAFALDNEQYSDIVETQFGYHIIMVDQHEQAGQATYEEVHTEIEPLLRDMYATERFESWLDELKKRSRVRVYL